MNELQIITGLWWAHRSASLLLAPRFTPYGWWEMDLMRVTRAGYCEEWEIKLTISDFRADAKKTSWRGKGVRGKHERLAAGDPAGPCRFTYVVPESLIQTVRAELPTWAGLWCALEHGSRVRFRRVVNAPTLHREKAPQVRIDRALRNMSARYWDLLIHRRNGEARDE